MAGPRSKPETMTSEKRLVPGTDWSTAEIQSASCLYRGMPAGLTRSQPISTPSTFEVLPSDMQLSDFPSTLMKVSAWIVYRDGGDISWYRKENAPHRDLHCFYQMLAEQRPLQVYLLIQSNTCSWQLSAIYQNGIKLGY